MATAISRESFFWHKLHSLTGIIPVGFYMVQHLTLNSFTLGGPDKFNGVVRFFASLPPHILYAMLIFIVWGPLVFHAVYGLFIANRAMPNLSNAAYRWRENRMYTYQRWSGIFIFFFLAYHTATTSIASKVTGNHEMIEYAAWQTRLTEYGHIWLIVYMVGILACCYHLSYGIWNFCIRWGITIGEKSQVRMQKFATVCYIGLTLLGWGALAGFFLHKPEDSSVHVASLSQPIPIRP